MRYFVSERVKAYPIVEEDIVVLKTISNDWLNKEFVEGKLYDEDYFFRCLNREDLPPIESASQDQFLFFKLIEKESNEIIGYLNCYMGYPNQYAMWIGDFHISSSHQNLGYGKEVIDQLIQESITLGYEKISLGVHLKNWSAINFWFKRGFDRIIKIVGEKDYKHNNFSIMVLEQTI